MRYTLKVVSKLTFQGADPGLLVLALYAQQAEYRIFSGFQRQFQDLCVTAKVQDVGETNDRVGNYYALE